MDPATRLARSLRPHVADRRVLDAIAAVPRELFVPPQVREHAYDDCALPIGRGQTISQPLIDQLAPAGRLVVPVGADGQRLVLLERSADGAELRRTGLEHVRFVPLVADEPER